MNRYSWQKTPVKQIKRRKFSLLSRNRYSFLLHFSVIITGLRFGTGVLQDNFVAELETHYENYILCKMKPNLKSVYFSASHAIFFVSVLSKISVYFRVCSFSLTLYTCRISNILRATELLFVHHGIRVLSVKERTLR